MKKLVNEEELKTRIRMNRQRLTVGKEYQRENLFLSADNYTWKGDMEGRALLAFVSHYKIDGSVIPCMENFLKTYEEKTGGLLYFAEDDSMSGLISEQQLAGHSWMLRGLCEHYEIFGDALALKAINAIFENLYLPLKEKIDFYPIDREKKNDGGVSGEHSQILDGWVLSSDTGTFFMSVDGLSHAYKVTGDSRIKEFLERMIAVFLKIDRVKLRMQTHCTLTAARGMLRLFALTDDVKYLNGAKDVYNTYIDSGMTYTYQNVNWWGRHDTWTEPCAIVDSIMLASELYKITKDESYRRTAARVYTNGLATAQRDNGGAGTDTVVTSQGKPILSARSYEAWFCCSMRLAEGLWYIWENKDLLYTESFGEVCKNQNGVYMDGDIVYVSVSDNLQPYAENELYADGIKLVPIVKYYSIPKDAITEGKQQVIF